MTRKIQPKFLKSIIQNTRLKIVPPEKFIKGSTVSTSEVYVVKDLSNSNIAGTFKIRVV